jgi:signal transduction histidine kinase
MHQSGYIVSLLVLLSTLLLASLSLFVMIIIQKHRKRVISHRSQIKSIVHNQEKNILDAQIKVQEQTFKSISSEIHDNIGQRLTLAKLQLNIALGNPHLLESVKNRIHNAVDSLTDCIADLRDLSRSLSYDRIGISGFQELIENDLKQLTSVYPISYDCIRHGELYVIGIDKELIIYRIFQEIIQNAIKHASANKFSVTLHYQKDHLNILFEDDGVGFDVNKIKFPNGLNNIRDRAFSMNSNMEIHSKPGLGTRITLKIPYNEQSQNQSNPS